MSHASVHQLALHGQRTVSSKSCAKTPDSSKRPSQFLENVEGSHTGQSRSGPTNHRKALLHCNSMISFRSDRTRIAANRARNNCSGEILGRPLSGQYNGRHRARMRSVWIKGQIRRSGGIRGDQVLPPDSIEEPPLFLRLFPHRAVAPGKMLPVPSCIRRHRKNGRASSDC